MVRKLIAVKRYEGAYAGNESLLRAQGWRRIKRRSNERKKKTEERSLAVAKPREDESFLNGRQRERDGVTFLLSLAPCSLKYREVITEDSRSTPSDKVVPYVRKNSFGT